jgi:hypothetical protein
VLAPVHDATDRRVSLSGDLDEVEILLAGTTERLGECDDPDLRAVGVDESDARDLDLGVDTALLLFDAGPLLVVVPPWQDVAVGPTDRDEGDEWSPSRTHARTSACDLPRRSWQVGREAACLDGSEEPSSSARVCDGAVQSGG